MTLCFFFGQRVQFYDSLLGFLRRHSWTMLWLLNWSCKQVSIVCKTWASLVVCGRCFYPLGWRILRSNFYQKLLGSNLLKGRKHHIEEFSAYCYRGPPGPWGPPGGPPRRRQYLFESERYWRLLFLPKHLICVV